MNAIDKFHNKHFIKKVNKYVRVRDDKYDYYVNIGKLNKKSFWKGFYKYKNKACDVYIFNKSDDPLKDQNVVDGIAFSISFSIFIIIRNMHFQISNLIFTIICAILALAVVLCNHLLYIYTNKEISKRLANEQYYKGKISVEYSKISKAKKNYQRTRGLIVPIIFILILIVFITNVFGYPYRMFAFISLVAIFFIYIRIFPIPETVDYVITK